MTLSSNTLTSEELKKLLRARNIEFNYKDIHIEASLWLDEKLNIQSKINFYKLQSNTLRVLMYCIDVNALYSLVYPEIISSEGYNELRAELNEFLANKYKALSQEEKESLFFNIRSIVNSKNLIRHF